MYPRLKLKIEGQTRYRKHHAAKLQNSNQDSTLFWVSLIGLQELRFEGDLNLYIILSLECSTDLAGRLLHPVQIPAFLWIRQEVICWLSILVSYIVIFHCLFLSTDAAKKAVLTAASVTLFVIPSEFVLSSNPLIVPYLIIGAFVILTPIFNHFRMLIAIRQHRHQVADAVASNQQRNIIFRREKKVANLICSFTCSKITWVFEFRNFNVSLFVSMGLVRFVYEFFCESYYLSLAKQRTLNCNEINYVLLKQEHTF